MSDVLKLVRPDLQGFQGYVSSADKAAGFIPEIKLDANEMPYEPFGVTATFCQPNRYAEPQPKALRSRMAAYWGCKPEQILTSCGSDQSIDILMRLFCQPGKDEVLICPPTFAMYPVYAKLQGANVLTVPVLGNGQYDIDGIEKTATENTKLIFLPTPHAPTGRKINKDDIIKLCELRKGKSIVVADEAYIEFSDDPEGCVPFIGKIDNLIVLRTLSKAHGLAGERVGCTIASEELIKAMYCVVPPYPIARSSIRAAMDVLSPAGLAQGKTNREHVIEQRERMRADLLKCDQVIEVYPSQGNFLFIITKDAIAFEDTLKKYGILVQAMDAAIKGGVRMTIGTPEENDLILKALGVDVQEKARGPRFAFVQRETKETKIEIALDLDHARAPSINTGIGFFDHMLAQLGTHGGIGLTIDVQGDLEIDGHHTIEDTALALGEAFRKALGDKKGIERFGFVAPLDEALAQVVLDLSGRPYAEMEVAWVIPPSDGMSPDLTSHFFRSFAESLGATIHIEAKGDNNHHIVEAIFKALGRAMLQAIRIEGGALPSTKGCL